MSLQLFRHTVLGAHVQNFLTTCITGLVDKIDASFISVFHLDCEFRSENLIPLSASVVVHTKKGLIFSFIKLYVSLFLIEERRIFH